MRVLDHLSVIDSVRLDYAFKYLVQIAVKASIGKVDETY